MAQKLSSYDKIMASYTHCSASRMDCERGFSKQNIIKNIKKPRLGLDTLHALMGIFLNDLELSNVD
jgi:hypothetical protein